MFEGKRLGTKNENEACVCVYVCVCVFSDILFWREKGAVWCLLGFDSKGRRLKNKGGKHGGFDANRVSKWKRTFLISLTKETWWLPFLVGVKITAR